MFQDSSVPVDLVNQLTSASLLQRLVAKGTRNPEHSRALIREKLTTDPDTGIAVPSLRMSLMCPLGHMRFSTPCRALTCTHLQCFDAAAYLQMNEKKPTWLCPICNRKAPYDALIIDGLFMEMLNSCSDVDEIQFLEDGSWHPVQPKEECQDVVNIFTHESSDGDGGRDVSTAGSTTNQQLELIDLTLERSSDADSGAVDDDVGINREHKAIRTAENNIPLIRSLLPTLRLRSKMFVGHLRSETSTADLRDYFSRFGDVVRCIIKFDVDTGRSRGFGFIWFRSATAVHKVLALKKHSLHGRFIYPIRAKGMKKDPGKKIFVGGLSPDINKDKIWEYFSTFGEVEAVQHPVDSVSRKPRGFGFVTFQDENSVWRALKRIFHVIGDMKCEVEVALPRVVDQNRFWGLGGHGRGRGNFGRGNPIGATSQDWFSGCYNQWYDDNGSFVGGYGDYDGSYGDYDGSYGDYDGSYGDYDGAYGGCGSHPSCCDCPCCGHSWCRAT